jgi:chromosomal replication initiator protein
MCGCSVSAQRILVRDIQKAVADLYGLPADIMREPDGMYGSRERSRVRPRQVAMYLSRQLCAGGKQREKGRASLTAIGRRFGGRDHTTILHGCRTVERFMLSDTEERRAVGEVGLLLIEKAR